MGYVERGEKHYDRSSARRLYADDDFGVELEGAAYALDTTTIDLCLSLFPGGHFTRTKAAVKLHTAMNLCHRFELPPHNLPC